MRGKITKICMYFRENKPKEKLKSRIGEEFYPLIDANPIPINNDYVLRIECKPSDPHILSILKFEVKESLPLSYLHSQPQWPRLNPLSMSWPTTLIIVELIEFGNATILS